MQGRLSATHPHFSWVSDKISYRKTSYSNYPVTYYHTNMLMNFPLRTTLPRRILSLTNICVRTFCLRTISYENFLMNFFYTTFYLDEYLRTNICIRKFFHTNFYAYENFSNEHLHNEHLTLRFFSITILFHYELLTWWTLYPTYFILTYFRQTNLIQRIIAIRSFSIWTFVRNSY